MIARKNKKCIECGRDDRPWFSNKRCKSCAEKSYGKPKQVSDKRKSNGGSGEAKLFVEIYKELKGRCEISGEYLTYDPKNFMHILSKGSRPDLRLSRDNVRHVKFEYHYGYDNVPKDIFLKEYPEAAIIYEWKEEAKIKK